MNRIRAWWRRYFGRRRGRHTADLVLAYLSDTEFWKEFWRDQ